jgi:acyl-ACP thioesterase
MSSEPVTDRNGSPDGSPVATMVPPPGAGRLFAGVHRVRLADVTPTGRMRLDGVARHLQDIAADDSRDSGLEGSEYWVVRRTTIAVHRFPEYQQLLAVSTWCGGVGSHWAERRTRFVDEGTGDVLVDAAALWVKVDAISMRPARVGTQFLDLYASATRGRKVSAKLSHNDPSTHSGSPWPLRFADFDALQHVNNAVGWEPVEEVLARQPSLRPGDGRSLVAEVEHRVAIERGARLTLVTDDGADPRGGDVNGADADWAELWLVADAGSASSPTVVLSATVRLVQSASV